MARLFGWDAINLAIYANTATAGDVSAGSTLGGYGNLISIFTDCHLSSTTEDYEGRAIGERGSYPLPYAEADTIEIGAVADASFLTLFALKKTYGNGPFWIWFKLSNGEQYRGRVIIGRADLVAPNGPVTQQGLLKVQGVLELAGFT